MADTKLTQDLQIKFVDFIRKGAFIHTACKACGITKPTYYNWKDRAEKDEQPYKDFLTAVETAEIQLEIDLTETLINELKQKKDWRAIMEFLSRRFKENWSTENKDIEDLEIKVIPPNEDYFESLNRPGLPE